MALPRSSSSRLDTFEEKLKQRRSSENIRQDETASELERCHADLLLSAQLGQALVQENTELKDRLATNDSARDQLLDRLAVSYRDNAQLEQRLDRTTAALEAAETSNRTLLTALEDDRKSLNKLSIEHARLSSVEKRFKNLTRERDDLKQELETQTRRAVAAESRASRATNKLADMENIKAADIVPGSTPSSPRRPSSVIRNRHRSGDSMSYRNSQTPSELAPPELLHLVGNLSDENSELKSNILELQQMLAASQEKSNHLKEELESNMHSQLTIEEDLSSSSSDISPEHSVRGSFIASSSPLINTATSPSNLSASTSGDSVFGYTLPDGTLKPSSRRRRSSHRPASAIVQTSTASKRRARSMDMSTLYDQLPNFSSRPASPALEPIADNSPATSRILSSEELQEREAPPSPSRERKRKSSAESTISHNSGPNQRLLLMSNYASSSRDMSVQTEFDMTNSSSATTPHAQSYVGSAKSSTASLHTGATDMHSLPTPDLSVSDTTTESAEHQRLYLSGDVPPDLSLPTFDMHSISEQSRTLALSSLVERVTKLTTKLKSADIATLEARLKKQKLPGDVGHLAKSTVKDILAEIEQLREQFKRVLDQERLGNKTAGSNAGFDISFLLQHSDQSTVTRRDFVQLVKLFKEVLSEWGRLRSIINRVQIDPALAYKMAELDALGAYEESSTLNPSRNLLAPLSRLFSSPAAIPVVDKAGSGKSSPLRAVTSDFVNVEFGANHVTRAISQPASAINTTPRLHGSPSHAGLRNIFAGSKPRDGKWLPSSAVPPERRQTLHRNTDYRRSVLSPQTDAVLDSFSQPKDASEQSTLLERTLHKRGLSDSSIRSTFMAQAPTMPVTPSSLALMAQTSQISTDDLHAILSSDGGSASASLISPGTSPGTHAMPIKASAPSTSILGSLSSRLSSSLAFETSRLNAISHVGGPRRTDM